MNFTMQRDRIVVSMSGRAIEFIKGVPTHVPQQCWAEVQAQGAVPEEDIPEPDKKGAEAPQGAERAAAIAKAIEHMVLRGERNDFTASGAPQAGALSLECGFTVDAKERDEAWTLAQNDSD